MPAGSTAAAALDRDRPAWQRSLRITGPAGDEARAQLHALLLRAARFHVDRRASSVATVRRDDLEQIALEAADHAYASVLRHLDVSGGRRFETWAAKFALHEANVRLQARAWRDRELPTEPALPAAIAEALTPQQRHVVAALVLNDVPIDVLAERLRSSRGAVYETLAAARQSLRGHLGSRGLTVV